MSSENTPTGDLDKDPWNQKDSRMTRAWSRNVISSSALVRLSREINTELILI